MKPGGNSEENGPFNYTDDQIEQILNGSIPLEICSMSKTESESLDRIVPCQICLSRQSTYRHFGAKSCRACKDFFVRSIQHAKVRVSIYIQILNILIRLLNSVSKRFFYISEFQNLTMTRPNFNTISF